MLKFITRPDKDGRSMLGLGLSFENLRRLKRDQPILVRAEDLGRASFGGIDRVAVFAGPNEEQMEAQLARYGMIDENADRRTFRQPLHVEGVRRPQGALSATALDELATHPAEFFFQGRCHPHSLTWVRYRKGSRVLEIVCAECSELVAAVEVAP